MPGNRISDLHRDWITFALVVLCLLLGAVCVLQWIDLRRKYVPKVVEKTVEYEVEKRVEVVKEVKGETQFVDKTDHGLHGRPLGISEREILNCFVPHADFKRLKMDVDQHGWHDTAHRIALNIYRDKAGEITGAQLLAEVDFIKVIQQESIDNTRVARLSVGLQQLASAVNPQLDKLIAVWCVGNATAPQSYSVRDLLGCRLTVSTELLDTQGKMLIVAGVGTLPTAKTE